MSITNLTFGNVLMQVANSVDHIDEATFSQVGQEVKDYVMKQLDIDYFDFQVGTMVDEERQGLIKVWASEGSEGQAAKPRTIRTDPEDKASYRNQSGYAFAKRLPLWIICSDKSPLYKGGEFHDDWSGSEGVPAYQKPIDRDLRTSIIVPVFDDEGDALGVINLESDQYVESTDVARKELRLLADAIAELYQARKSTVHQADTTREAIAEMRKILEAGGLPMLTKPHIFIAFSKHADKKVIGIINEVLNGFRDHLVPVPWSRSSFTGNITEQVLADIAKSRFGLCYFSEPDEGSDTEFGFRDNANVVFEAGMMHSLTNAPTDRPTGWIPVREEESPPMPFDFAQQRTLIVPRGGDGELNVEKFEDDLTEWLQGLVHGERER